jgi:hypothetical protein
VSKFKKFLVFFAIASGNNPPIELIQEALGSKC